MVATTGTVGTIYGGIKVDEAAAKLTADIAARAEYDKAEYSNADRSRIFGNRFVSDFIPGWHKKGTVANRYLYVREAYESMGPYDVVALPLLRPDGTPSPNRDLVRLPVEGETEPTYFGCVSADYELITPEQFVELWEQYVNRPVSTMLSLREGRVLIITTMLPEIDVKGDRVENYLVGANGMSGTTGLDVLTGGMRVQCQNTLTAAKKGAGEFYHLRHDEKARERAGRWMADAVEKAERKVAVLTEAYNILGGFFPKAKEVESVVKATFPGPKLPRSNMPKTDLELKMRAYERDEKTANIRRAEMLEIFETNEDLVKGMAVPTLRGSGWQLYQAAGFISTHSDARSDEDRLYSLLYGKRHEIQQRAFDKTYDLAAK